MNELLLCLLSPVIALLFAIVVASVAIQRKLRKPPVRILIVRSVIYSLTASAISLGGTIAWMVWYERTSGYSAGNGPIAWIFVYGPLSVALGTLIALVHWWMQRVPAT